MSQQSLLPGFEEPPALTDRLFFAVLPDADAQQSMAALVAQLRSAHGLQSRAVLADRLHATLCVLGDYPGLPAGVLASAEKAAQAAAQTVAPFSASFDQVLTFMTRSRTSGRRPLVLTGGEGVVGLHGLYTALARALLKAGVAGNPSSFTPHVTLMYDECVVPAQGAAPVSWSVHELVLLHSRIGQNLPYAVLGRWPLRLS